MSRVEVTSKMQNTELDPQTSSGVFTLPVRRLLTDSQRRIHQQSTSSTLEAPFDRASKVKTKGILMTNEDSKEVATDKAPHPNVEA